MQEYKRVTAWHRSLFAKKVKLQAKTESIKKQFEAAVDQLTEVSSKIEEAEAQIERAHARVKEKVNEPKQPKLTAITGLLKEAGIDLSQEQTGALDKWLATNGDRATELPGLGWKAAGELLEGPGWLDSYGPNRADKTCPSTSLANPSDFSPDPLTHFDPRITL